MPVYFPLHVTDPAMTHHGEELSRPGTWHPACLSTACSSTLRSWDPATEPTLTPKPWVQDSPRGGAFSAGHLAPKPAVPSAPVRRPVLPLGCVVLAVRQRAGQVHVGEPAVNSSGLGGAALGWQDVSGHPDQHRRDPGSAAVWKVSSDVCRYLQVRTQS